MGIGDRIFEAVKFLARLSDEIDGLSEDITRLSREVRNHEARIIRLETAMELASGGLLKVAQSRLDPPNES